MKIHYFNKNWLTDYSSSLVKFTGLLVSVGVLSCIISCGQEPKMFDVEADGTQVDELVQEVNTSEIDDSRKVQDTEMDSKHSEASKGTELSGSVHEAKAEETIVVHICGAVINPGVYELDSGARIIDAVVKSGGFADEACEDALNLAMEISDGSRVYIPTFEECNELLGGSNSEMASRENFGASDEITNIFVSKSATDKTEERSDLVGLVNINTANIDRLISLPGIGETRAKAIIAYREEHGSYKSVEEIMNVNGIKAGSFEKIKEYITVN